MANLDFERVLNPWLFDKSGNLTAEAKKRFPDLASTPAPIGTGATECMVAGAALLVNPPALKAAGDNANHLGNKMVADCQTPIGDDLYTAASAMSGWALGLAISSAHNVWENQFLSLGSSLIAIGSQLHDTATSYTGTENANHQRMSAS